MNRLLSICLTLAVAGAGPLLGQNQVAIKAFPVEGIEYKPLPAIFAVAARGEVKEVAMELTNRRPEELELGDAVTDSDRFTARVETLELGRRYRVVVTLKGEGPVGKREEMLEIQTNFVDAPVLRIPVNSRIRERVYTFPETVFMGRFPLSEIAGNSQMAQSRAQTLMVYRKGMPGFEIKATSDIPYLTIESERSSDGDRWENTIFYDAEKATAGEIKGKIFIETNDPSMPKLEVPIWGDLQDR